MSWVEMIFALLACSQICNALLTNPRHLAQLPTKFVQRRIRSYSTDAPANDLSSPCISGLSEIADLYDAFLVCKLFSSFLFETSVKYLRRLVSVLARS